MSEHDTAASKTQYDDPQATATTIVGIVGVLIVVLTVIALETIFYRTENDENSRKVYAESYEQVVRLRAEQLTALNSYAWQDKSKGIVRIPIDQAMKLVIDEARSGPEKPPRAQGP